MLIREVNWLFENYNFSNEKKRILLEALKLYIEGNEIVEIAAKMGRSINTVKGYFSELKSHIPENDMKTAKEIHIVRRFDCKDNLYAFIKDCYEKGLPISDIPDLLGRYYPDARMLYKQLENTESKDIRYRVLKLKGMPAEFEDIAFFYLMGRYRLPFSKMFGITTSEMNKVRKYLDSIDKEAIDNVYKRVEGFSSDKVFSEWLKVMELYHYGATPEQIKKNTNIDIPEIKKFINMYENNRVFEALPRANVILTYLGDFVGQREFDKPCGVYDFKYRLD